MSRVKVAGPVIGRDHAPLCSVDKHTYSKYLQDIQLTTKGDRRENVGENEFRVFNNRLTVLSNGYIVNAK